MSGIIWFVAGLAAGLLAAGLFFFVRLSAMKSRCLLAEERVKNAEGLLNAERATVEKLQKEFRSAAVQVLKEDRDEFLSLAIRDLRQVKTETDAAIGEKKDEITSSVEKMQKDLTTTQELVRRFEEERSQMYGRLEKSLAEVMSAEQAIRIEAGALKRALTTGAGIRGPMGQMVLQDILEQNGLLRGVHFDIQISIESDQANVLRPDFLVYLPGGKRMAIDAKEVGGEYLLAQETEDPTEQKNHYERLVTNIRSNFQRLSKKEYQASLDPEIPYVVMFIPSEAAIRAAFTTDHGIFQEAAEKRVILASPMTIIPLIYLIRHSWQQNQLAENARELGESVESLGVRLGKFVEHLQNIRSGLKKAVESWDQAQGSWKTRVVPQIERTRQLGGRLKDAPNLEPIDGISLGETALKEDKN